MSLTKTCVELTVETKNGNPYSTFYISSKIACWYSLGSKPWRSLHEPGVDTFTDYTMTSLQSSFRRMDLGWNPWIKTPGERLNGLFTFWTISDNSNWTESLLNPSGSRALWSVCCVNASLVPVVRGRGCYALL